MRHQSVEVAERIDIREIERDVRFHERATGRVVCIPVVGPGAHRAVECAPADDARAIRCGIGGHGIRRGRRFTIVLIGDRTLGRPFVERRLQLRNHRRLGGRERSGRIRVVVLPVHHSVPACRGRNHEQEFVVQRLRRAVAIQRRCGHERVIGNIRCIQRMRIGIECAHEEREQRERCR